MLGALPERPGVGAARHAAADLPAGERTRRHAVQRPRARRQRRRREPHRDGAAWAIPAREDEGARDPRRPVPGGVPPGLAELRAAARLRAPLLEAVAAGPRAVHPRAGPVRARVRAPPAHDRGGVRGRGLLHEPPFRGRACGAAADGGPRAPTPGLRGRGHGVGQGSLLPLRLPRAHPGGLAGGVRRGVRRTCEGARIGPRAGRLPRRHGREPRGARARAPPVAGRRHAHELPRLPRPDERRPVLRGVALVAIILREAPHAARASSGPTQPP
mmetsp:Transcript_66847/g.188210  ORF Transcript_66847/g.188210 Transcript_66847/m.188210 type:complete len:272 (+) Transcript_66847:544-1359(+)